MKYRKESFEINFISAIAVVFALLISLFAWL
jgi:hypothetical protein